MYFLLTIALITSTTVANSDWLMSCKDYDWFVEGVEKSEVLTEIQKDELKERFREATRPGCFWDEPANG